MPTPREPETLALVRYLRMSARALDQAARSERERARALHAVGEHRVGIAYHVGNAEFYGELAGTGRRLVQLAERFHANYLRRRRRALGRAVG